MGINDPLKVSPAMQAIVGKSTMARGDVLKAIWAYINANNCKGPDRTIVCDAKLSAIFDGQKSIPSTKIMSYMSKHLSK